MPESDSSSPHRQYLFLEVSTSEGAYRRFAAGTKAGFAIDRINRNITDLGKKYSFIESFKEGDEAVEFGPDAELVNYGRGWKLRAVQDFNALKPAYEGEVKDGIKTGSQTFGKEFDPADFYPGGKLPASGSPTTPLIYFQSISVVLGFILLMAGVWIYLLEVQFFMRA